MLYAVFRIAVHGSGFRCGYQLTACPDGCFGWQTESLPHPPQLPPQDMDCPARHFRIIRKIMLPTMVSNVRLMRMVAIISCSLSIRDCYGKALLFSG